MLSGGNDETRRALRRAYDRMYGGERLKIILDEDHLRGFSNEKREAAIDYVRGLGGTDEIVGS